MVTFTCQNCNSCLKKKVVETHLFKCKNPQLTCIDCLKDFNSKSYVGHVTCITEDERYGGQSYTPTSGMQKQTQWHQCIIQVLRTSKLDLPVLKNIIQYASEFPTSPRNKKKFVNFILNNKTFSSARSLAEKAYDLISEEFNKSQGINGNSKQVENVNGKTDESAVNNGKRKKISETELAEETARSDTNEQLLDKASRKKNKKNNLEISQENGKVENGESGHKKNKKKNKQSNMNENKEVTQNGDEIADDSVQSKKKKKSKDKQKKNKVNQDIGIAEEEESPSNEQEIEQNEEEKITPAEDNLEKLSKKERKKLLKLQKYKAEIESIENYKKPEEDVEEACPDESVADPAGDGEKRRKKKKTHTEQEEIREQKNSISEPDDKKIRLEGEDEEEAEPVVSKPKKFSWDHVIVEVLQSQDDGEMSLKRLSKKVCSEYAAILGEPKSWEDVLLKFNKKVIRTPGVRVFKDKAKLISEL